MSLGKIKIQWHACMERLQHKFTAKLRLILGHLVGRGQQPKNQEHSTTLIIMGASTLHLLP